MRYSVNRKFGFRKRFFLKTLLQPPASAALDCGPGDLEGKRRKPMPYLSRSEPWWDNAETPLPLPSRGARGELGRNTMRRGGSVSPRQESRNIEPVQAAWRALSLLPNSWTGNPSRFDMKRYCPAGQVEAKPILPRNSTLASSTDPPSSSPKGTNLSSRRRSLRKAPMRSSCHSAGITSCAYGVECAEFRFRQENH